MIFRHLALVILHSSLSLQYGACHCAEPKDRERVSIARRWEKTIDGLHPVDGARLSVDGKHVLCRVKDHLVLLDGTNGEVLWENYQFARATFGYNLNELVAFSLNSNSIGVLNLKTGKLVREFKGPSGVYLEIQTRNGWIYWCEKSSGRIKRFKEGENKAEILFDYKKSGEMFGEVRRVPNLALLYADEHKLLFTVVGALAAIDVGETQQIRRLPNETFLHPNRMLHRSNGRDPRVYVSAHDSVVEIAASGDLRAVTNFPVYEHGFVNRERKLLIYSESTGEHQPAFIHLHETDTAYSRRTSWLSEEIGALVPDSAASSFISFNRAGQIALWEVIELSKE